MLENGSSDYLWRFWAKTTHDKNTPTAYHPLLCHLIDVAAVTRLMWRAVLSPAARARLAVAFGLLGQEELAGRLMAFIAGLHDLGKASPPFALRHTTQNVKQLYDGTPFANARKCEPQKAPHGYVTACELPEILAQDFGFPPRLASLVGVVIGGHHGVFPRSGDVQNMEAPTARGPQRWREARRKLAQELAQVCEIPARLEFSAAPRLDNATAMLLAGLVSVADWIGSNSDYFPCCADTEKPLALDAQDYWAYANKQAREALCKLRWLDWPMPDAPRSFAALFPRLTPRALQTACEALAQSLNSPGLVVIESPMGEGKTEAAMYLADHWNATLRQRGCYFALPTQATSNQMFGRVKEFLDARFNGQVTLLQLLHGQAALNAEFEAMLKMPLTKIYDEEGNRRHGDDCTPQVVAAEWFTYRKRGLLAPFGVGTVDQALLAVLQTKHVFVRLFGLAHKTIIIDEVHAYDAYMSALLERLLEWLAALGSPVVLLSATLPRARRDALLQAYRRGLGVAPGAFAPDEAPYPRLSWTDSAAAGAQTIETSQQNTRTLHLRHLRESAPATATDVFPLGVELQKALAGGGCAAVICNTVGRAQEMFQALQPYFDGKADDGAPELDLLHARFLFRDRETREKRALLRFGKPGGTETDSQGRKHPVRRPRRAVLVATQIIEQSLDLDFDLMVSDLAPLDLLLQRSGRLHRHRRARRPPNLSAPTLWILQPALNADGAPDFGVSRWVYAPHILLRSWLQLRGRAAIEIPADIETLIEAVYDDTRLCPDDAYAAWWGQTLNEMRGKLAVKEGKAKAARILSPHYEDLFEDFNPRLQEDRPDSHKTIQALTRDDELPSLSVVALLPDEWRRARGRIDLPSARFLLERSVGISHRTAVDVLLAETPPSAWQDSPLLRHHRLLELDAGGRRQIGAHHFILDPLLGVIIRKEED